MVNFCDHDFRDALKLCTDSPSNDNASFSYKNTVLKMLAQTENTPKKKLPSTNSICDSICMRMLLSVIFCFCCRRLVGDASSALSHIKIDKRWRMIKLTHQASYIKFAVMRNKHVSISSLSNITCSFFFSSFRYLSLSLSLSLLFAHDSFIFDCHIFGLAIKFQVIEKTKMKRSNKRNVMKLNKFGAYANIISIQCSVTRFPCHIHNDLYTKDR